MAATERTSPRGETMTHDPTIPTDLPPVPPVAPEPADCCGEGCVRCVYDMYDESLERYRTLLAAWRASHPDQAT
jgi:hypothetical protein